jgi:Ser/Thr protein kinase RdoA (MazF antagonist)
MKDTALEPIPLASRETARATLDTAFGASAGLELRPVPSGASGALVYRVDVAGRPYLLRLETRRDALRNPHQYECLRIAADAGVAPALIYLDADAGAVVMDFVAQRPLGEFPGGPAGVARELGRLAARLHATPRFPAVHDYSLLLLRMFAWLRGSGLFAAPLLEPHGEAFERIREAYPWNAVPPVSSHNDPNPHNLLFDGKRLWLIDWETSYANDPLTDVAILADNFARTRELEAPLLEAWLGGRAPGRELEARLYLMRLLTRLYYASLLLYIAAARRPHAAPAEDLSAPTPDELAAAAARGELDAASPDTLHAVGRRVLASFLAGTAAPRFDEALRIVRTG